MDETERRIQRAQQLAANKEKGAQWEAVVEQTMQDKLRHNHERQQAFGDRKPDFSVHNDDGERMAFVEVKSHEQANQHDFEQTLDAIEQAAQQPGGERLIIVTQNGEDFFTPEQHEQINEHAANNKVTVQVVNFEQWEQVAEQLANDAGPSAPPASPPTPPPTPPAQGGPSSPPAGGAGGPSINRG